MATATSNPFDVRVSVPTSLSTTAAGMAPGSWTVFNCNFSTGTLDALLDVGGGKRCTEYADKMVWDSSLRLIYFTGGGHGQQEKTIVYNDDTVTWTDLGSPPWYSVNPGGATHGYQHNALIGTTHYYLQFGTNTIHTRDVTQGNAAWGVLPIGGLSLGGGATGVLEYFPTFGAGGSLIAVQGVGGGEVWRRVGTTWSIIATPAMGGYQNAGVYSPIKDLMYLGGGNGSAKLYTMAKNGRITARASCPVGFGINQSVTTVDPVSGKLLLACADKQIRVYDPVADVWTSDIAPPPGFWSGTMYSEGQVMGIVAAPIYDYGLTMFLTISGSAIYLRKGR